MTTKEYIPLVGSNALVEAFTREESERQKVVDRIHNDILQDLGSGLIKAEICSRLLALGKYDDARNSIEALRASIDSSIESLRDLMIGLRPYSPDQRGILGALDDYARHYERTYGVRIVLSSDTLLSCGFIVELVLYRLFQEILDAAVSQLGMRSVNLGLVQNSDSIILEVREPDGIIDTLVDDELTPWPAIRQSLQQLAELVRGDVEIFNREEGSGIVFTLPLPFE